MGNHLTTQQIYDTIENGKIDEVIMEDLIELNELPSVGTQVSLMQMLKEICKHLIEVELHREENRVCIDGKVLGLKEFIEYVDNNFTTHIFKTLKASLDMEGIA